MISVSQKDSANLVDGSETTETSGTGHSFLSFKFYQQYFDVDTEQVQTRIMNSAFPKKDGNFIRDHLNPTPDLYGPFWIAVTLVFSAAICGNFAHYIDSMGKELYANDFKLVTGISTLIASYVLLVPFALYLTLYYRKSSIQYSFVELVALYGYSLAILIPVSILCVLNYNWFRWTLIIISVALSGPVLATSIWEAVKADKNKLFAIGIVAGVVILHAGLAIGMKEYYFDTISPAKSGQVDLSSNTENTPLPLIANTQPEVKPPIAAALVSSNATDSNKKDDKEITVKLNNTITTKKPNSTAKKSESKPKPEKDNVAGEKHVLTTEKSVKREVKEDNETVIP